MRGLDWCRGESDCTDEWLREVFAEATETSGDGGLALVAVGGYGRRELYPQSDLDLMLLHDGRSDVAEFADRIWYPIWDAGRRLGHSVRTSKQALDLARRDLDTATALLDGRHLAGDRSLTDALLDRHRSQWMRDARRWLGALATRVEELHLRHGEVAFLLEPDLKDGHGGLRDVHAVRWAAATRHLLLDVVEEDRPAIEDAHAVLATARVALHQVTGSTSNQLLLQDQDAVAAATGDGDAEALMAGVAGAARTIAWVADDTWRRIRSSLRGPTGRLARRDRPVAPGIVERDGEIHVDVDAGARDMTAAVRAAAAAAQRSTVIARPSLQALAACVAAPADPWPAELREAFVSLLLAGAPAIDVIEALDHVGLWVRVLPEWEPVRSRPQRNAYHRFTVDRHLVETAANAAQLAGDVERPDLLVVGALLHDIGKGRGGDHTEVGIELVRTMGGRFGFTGDDVDVLVAMVAHHLLLPDVATRRDLDDPATIDRVAREVGSPTTLHLLAALTEADSLATGPSAWSPWKAGLVDDLVERVAHVLRGGAIGEVTREHAPDERDMALLDAATPHVEVRDGEVVVVARDEPGLFSRIAGVLALNGVPVLDATAHSSGDGWALERFRVDGSSDGPSLAEELAGVLADGSPLHERIERKVATYRGTGSSRYAALVGAPSISVDNDASAVATVIDVHALDEIGVLFRITSVLAALELDIRSAKVETMGPHAVDAFYVTDRQGRKVTDPATIARIEQTVAAALRG